MCEMMQGYLKEKDIRIKSGNNVNSIMRDMMSVLLEGALDEELNEELGCSKYDYCNFKRPTTAGMDIPQKNAYQLWRYGCCNPKGLQRGGGTAADRSSLVYPKTEIQQCIIHQIWNTTNYVSYKDLKKLMADI